MEQDSDVQREALEGDTYLPRRYLHGPIAHYYGDLVRRIFLGIAVVLLIAAPFLGDAAFTLLPFEIIGALVLIILSALTNPKNKTIMIANAGASVVGAIVFELTAFAAYRAELPGTMLGFQAFAVAFIFALYFSLKTIRAMELGQIGQRDLPGEFMEEKYRDARGHR